MKIELFEAAQRGDCKKISYWLARGADVNFKNPEQRGNTPLLAAVAGQHESAVILLIEHGADVNALNSKNWSALDLASVKLSLVILRRLLASGAHVTPRCIELATCRRDKPNRKKEVIALLTWALTQNTFHLNYFLPFLYMASHTPKLLTAKGNLLSSYTCFDRESVTSQVEQAYQLDPSFHMSMPVIMRGIARKYGLSNDKLDILYRDFMRKDVQKDSQLSIILSQTLKYAIKNGASISLSKLIDALEKIDNEAIKYELIWALAYEKQKNLQLESGILQRLAHVMNGISHPAKHILLSHEDVTHDESAPKFSSDKKKKITPVILRASKAEVAKQLHTVKTTYKDQQVEEAEVNITSLIEALKNKRMQMQCHVEKVPTIHDKAGNDRTWHHGTYSEVLSLYDRAMRNGTLKQDDKDNYLPSKFLDNTAKWFCGDLVVKFFADIMICRIFHTISKKQKVNSKTIQKLMMCIDDLDQLKIKLFGTDDKKIIAPGMINKALCKKQYKNCPEIIANVADKIYSQCDVNMRWIRPSCHYDEKGIMDIVASGLKDIRKDAMSAIYNSVLRDKSILSKNEIKKIERCLRYDDPALKKIALKILGILGSSDDIDYKALFNEYLSQLLEGSLEPQEAEDAINYITRQLHDTSRAKKLFTDEVIVKILSCINRPRLNHQSKLGCLYILSSYLHQFSTQRLSPEHLTKLMNFIKQSKNNELIEESLKVLLIHSTKTKCLNQRTVSELISLMNTASSHSADFIIMILVNVIDQLPSNFNIDFNLVAFKLLDSDVIVEEIDDINFAPRTRDNQSCQSISTLAAKIIVSSLSLRNSVPVTHDTFMALIKAIASPDKQTRILSAKALFLSGEKHSEKNQVDNEILFAVQPYLHDVTTDVSVYTTVFYVESLHQLALLPSPLPTTHLHMLTQVYVIDELRLGDVDYSQRVNARVLEILEKEISKKQKLDEGMFQIFEFVFLSTYGHENFFSKRWLDILTQYVIRHKNTIPDKTIDILENLLSIEEYYETSLAILMGVVKNGQSISEKTFAIFQEILLTAENKKCRNDIFECLSIADLHQDLPNSVFNTLELERAGKTIASDAPDRKDALAFLENATSAGEKLTLNVLNALANVDKFDDRVLCILKNAALNKQCLSKDVMQTLTSLFVSGKFVNELIEIFFSLARNNQEMPKVLIKALKGALETPTISDSILSIFLIKGQQGEHLSKKIIEKIFDWCLRSDDHPIVVAKTPGKAAKSNSIVDDALTIKQASLASLYSILQKAENDEYALLAEKVFMRYLADSHIQIVKSSITGIRLLINKYTLSTDSIDALLDFVKNCQHNSLKTEVSELLTHITLNDKQQSAVNLMSLVCESDDEYLKRCYDYAQRANLLKNNFDRIHQILLQRTDLHLHALEVLSACLNIEEMQNALIEQMLMLKTGSPSKEVRQMAEQILAKIPEIAQGASLSESEMYSCSEPNADKVIRSILDKEISVSSLRELKNVLPQINSDALDKTLSVLMESFHGETSSEDINILISKCLTFAMHYVKDPAKYQTFFEKNIYSPNERIRSECFRGLLFLENSGHESSDFMEYCDDIKKAVEEQTGKTINDKELLQIIISLKYVNFAAITHTASETWARGLIISDWAERFHLDSYQKVSLYEKWAATEKHLDNPNLLLTLLHDIDSISFDELFEIIHYLPKIDTETFNTIITSSENVYSALRQVWLKQILLAKVALEGINTIYLDTLLSKLATKLPIGVAEKLILSIEEFDITEFESAIDFIHQHDILDYQIEPSHTFHALTTALKVNLLNSHFNLNEKSKLTAAFNTLLTIGWSFDELYDLIDISIIKDPSSQRELNLFHVLYMIAQYEFPASNYLRIKEILETDDVENWITAINQLVIHDNFLQTSLIKSPAQLINDLRENNQRRDLSQNGLLDNINYINSDKFDHWSRKNILAWANAVKANPEYFSEPQNIVEAIAIAKRANFLITGFQLTNTQILACLVGLKCKNDCGRLLEVQTGEGKTIIISVMAIIKGLDGKTVDIVTDSPVDAELHTRSQAPLYQMFGLTVADNLDRSIYLQGPKKCYERDIVYGEISQFQFDTLRDEYGLLGTKAGRECDEILADEVDSMLIDDSTKIAKLTSPVAGIDQLTPVYFFLSTRFDELQKRILCINEKMYLFYGVVLHQENRFILCYEEEGDLKQIPDLEHYLSTHTDISKIGQPILGDPVEFIEKHLNDYLEKLIQEGIIRIPVNFKEFVEKQKSKWIKNLITARLEFQDGAHYIVQNDLVKPVALDSNGTIQNSTHWSDGLHQFLQIENGSPISSETFTTNFLSVSGYFKRYGSRLCGLTGTLGPVKAKEKLSSTYGVDCIEIPSMREKQYKEFPTILAANELDWMSEIRFEVLHEIKKGRGVLIICKEIKQVLLLEKFIKSKYRAAIIKTYTMNGCDQEKEIERIVPGEIIIATSLGGRGMDIKADAINKFGGMPVILTYAADDRGEKQALYRTSRQGKLGTGRKILNRQDLLANGYSLSDLDHLEEARDRFEAQQLDYLFDKELKPVEKKDALFEKFRKLITSIRKDIRTKRSASLQDVKRDVRSLFSDVSPSVYESTMVSAIEERWALFLRDINDDTVSLDSVDSAYEAFEKHISHDYETGEIIQNPCHHIVIANDLILNASFFNNPYDKAMQHYEAAIAKDRFASLAAFVGKAWIFLKTKESSGSQNYKQLAIASFEEARKLFYDEISYLNSLYTVMQEQGVNPAAALLRQLTQKIGLLGTYVKSIESDIQAIKQSQRLMTLTQSQTFQNTHPDEFAYHSDLVSQHTVYHEIERNADGETELALTGGGNFHLQFNDLTHRQDMRTIDQAVNTIEAAFSDVRLGKKYDKISILLSHIDLASIQSLLNPKTEFKNLKKENALEKLRDTRTLLEKLPKHLFAAPLIHLDIISKEGRHETRKKLSITKAIKIINAISDDSQIDLSIMTTNKVTKFLSVEFVNMNQSDATQRLDHIASNSIDIELSGDKEELQKVIQEHPDLEKIQIIQAKEKQLMGNTYYRESAIQYLDDLTEAPLAIKLSNLKKDVAQKVIQSSKDLMIHLCFNHVDVKTSSAALTEGLADVRFSKLPYKMTEPFISYLREEKIEFALCFDQLTQGQVNKLISKADLAQEDLKIPSIKSLGTLFPEYDNPVHELIELSARGIEHILEIHERNFIPWISVSTMCILASVQMAAGAALISSGFGANVGMGLITEGAADLAIACRAGVSRQFSWNDYCKQKAVSLVISATCIGWQSLKNAGQGIKQGATNILSGVTEEALEQAGTQVLTNGKTIGKTLAQSSRELHKLAFQQMGVTLAETGGREVLNQAVDTLSQACFEQYKPQISSSIRNKVAVKFRDSLLSKTINKMQAIDEMRGTPVFSARIDYVIRDILGPQHAFWRKQWDSVGLPLCKGILSAPQYLGTPFSMGMRIIGILNGMKEIICVIDNFHEQLLDRLSVIDGDMLSIPKLLEHHCSLKPEEAIEITELLSKQKFIVDCQHISQKELSLAEFGKYEHHKKSVISFLTTLRDTIASSDHRPTITLISEIMTGHIIMTTQSQLVAPITSYVVAGAVNSLSERVQDAIIRTQLKSEIRNISEELDTLSHQESVTSEAHNRVRELKSDLGERTAFMQQGENLTVAQRIRHSAAKKTVAYSQCSSVFFATSKQDSRSSYATRHSMQHVEGYAQAVQQDKSANLSDMMLMAASNDISLKIVDDPNYRLTEEDKERDTKVAVFIKGEKDAEGISSVGHWRMFDKTGQLAEPTTGEGNDCGYAVFSELTGKSVKQLRSETAQAITENPKQFSHAIEAQDWLSTNNPKAANDLLFNGGRECNCEDCRKRRKREEEKKPKFLNLSGSRLKKASNGITTGVSIADESLKITDDTYNASHAVYSPDCKIPPELQLEQIQFEHLKDFDVNIGIYKNYKDDIIIAFQGTDFSKPKSVADSAPLLVGEKPLCTETCEKFVKEFLSEELYRYPNSKVILTGHSKGAAIAAYLSKPLGLLPAIVFDNPGLRYKHHDIHVMSIQSSRNQVNMWPGTFNAISVLTNEKPKYLLENLMRLTGLSSSYKGKEIHLNDPNLSQWSKIPVTGPLFNPSHNLNHIGNLIGRDDNKEEIRRTVRNFKPLPDPNSTSSSIPEATSKLSFVKT